MNRFASAKNKNIALGGIFFALIFILQLLSNFIKIGPISITLTLIPVVLAGVIGGIPLGAWAGFAFSASVYLYALLGLDVGGHILFEANPLLLIILVFGKGVTAGVVPALIYKATSNKKVGVVLASASAPVLNTGIFLVMMFLFFKETLTAWAGGSALIVYAITGLAGFNFIFEFIANVVLSSTITAVSKYYRSK